MEESGLDKMINHLLEKGCRWENSDFLLFNSEIQQLHKAFIKRINEPRLVHIKPPVMIAGNIHGQYDALLSIFEHGGLPPQSKYLFLGNYNGTPGDDMETILLLLAFKLKYPDNIFLLRGNLDSLDPLSLLDDVEIKSFKLLYIYECFNNLPVAALINNKILCTNGGLSPNLHRLDQIRQFNRGPQDKNSKLLDDLLGLCPLLSEKVKNDDNTYAADVKEFPLYCSEQVKKFLEKYDLHLICCGYKVVGGYKVCDEQRLVYICSARSGLSDYPSKFSEIGAMMSVDAKLRYSFHILEPKGRGWSSYKNQPESTSKPNFASSSVAMKSESSLGNNFSEFNFDPNALYRSKSPGVKRFLGARV